MIGLHDYLKGKQDRHFSLNCIFFPDSNLLCCWVSFSHSMMSMPFFLPNFLNDIAARRRSRCCACGQKVNDWLLYLCRLLLFVLLGNLKPNPYDRRDKWTEFFHHFHIIITFKQKLTVMKPEIKRRKFLLWKLR